MKITKLLGAGLLSVVLGAMSAPAIAAGAGPQPPQESWSFAGPFGKFDPQQLQRGFKVYREVCAACHSLKYVSFRNLSEPGGPMFTEGQVKALAAEYKIQDGPNDAGEMFERPGRPADHWPSPFPNNNAAAAANGGTAPPDLSLMAKARTYERGFPTFVFDMFTQYAEQGPDYLHALLVGYTEKPKDFHQELSPGQYYNKYFPGHVIAMPKPINDGQVDYKGPDGKLQAPETIDQYSRDVTAFLMWTAEPKLEARKAMGFKVVIFLIILAGLTYFTKKRIWKRLPDPV